MTDVTWKRFKFFDIEQVRNDSIQTITEKDIMCATSGGGFLFFGDAEGGVSVVGRGFSVQRFQAFNQRCNHLYQTKKGRVLVAIGDAMEHRGFEEQQESQYAAKQNREQGNKKMGGRGGGGSVPEEVRSLSIAFDNFDKHRTTTDKPSCFHICWSLFVRQCTPFTSVDNFLTVSGCHLFFPCTGRVPW